MLGALPPLPNTPPWCGALVKHGDNFTITRKFVNITGHITVLG